MRHKTSKLIKDGLFEEAMSLYAQLHSASVPTHQFTFPPLLKACAKLKSPLQGQMLHAHVIKTGFASQIYTATALADMYMKLNLLSNALKMFGEMPSRNLASLNVAISGFSGNGFSREALLVFREAGFCGYRPNSVTIASVLPACDSAELCLQLHCWTVKLGVESDIFVATSLVTVYSFCGEITLATRVFEELPNRSVVCYNAFLSGLLQNGVPIVVLNVFKDMRQWSSEKPNSVTLVSVISACAGLLYLQFGKQVHGFIMKTELGYATIVGTALLDMYSKCGCWPWAYKIFNELNGKRNLITWNAMIAGMMLNGQSDNAVELFECLKTEGLEPDSATWNSIISGFVQLEKGFEAFKFFKKMQSSGIFPSLKSVTSLLPACASLCAVQYGKEIHGHAIRTDINTDEFVATALIDMYMKCGYSSSARNIFDYFEIKPKDPAFWNAIISGYGRNGEDKTAIEIFDQMLERKIKPNSATFTSVLSMCSHLGQVDKGWQVFRMMTRDYGLDPNPEHFGCMVDLFGRFGKLDEARKLIEHMSDPPASVFASLLGSCGHHLHFELGEEMAMKLSDLKPEDPSPLVILSNIYAGVGRWYDVERIREMINARELRKLPGYSSIAST